MSSLSPPCLGDVSFPKNKIKVLLLERISQSAVQIFKNEGFDVSDER